MEEIKPFEAVITAEKKLFYSDKNSFGIYAVNVDEIDDWNKVELNVFGNITVKGSMPELLYNTPYIATLIPKKDAKYGMGYEVKSIYSKPITTIEDQKRFLSAILTENQVKIILDRYPDENVIDLIKTNQFDYQSIKGLGDKTYDKIKQKIAENEKYQKAISILTGEFGVSYKAVRKLSEHYESPDLLLQKVRDNPYILTEVEGYGFKRVDEIALRLGINKSSPNRVNACVEYILNEQANSGHCWVKSTSLINEALKLLNIQISEIESVLDNGHYKYKFEKDKNRIYLCKHYTYEKSIQIDVSRLLSSSAKYSINKDEVEKIISGVELQQGFSFTDEQKTAINLAVSHNIVIVNGKAGTGKTSVIKGIVEVLKGVKGLKYATCALSGKASQRIQESTGLDSYTIHRLLSYGFGGFGFDELNQLEHDVIILDEASMVNSHLFHALIKAIKSGAKLIIAGDTAQLEPIGVGNVLIDLLNSGKVPKVELTKVHRQAQRSGILSCANMVRDGVRFLTSNEYKKVRLGELKDLYMYPYSDKDKVLDAVLSICKKYKGDLLDFQVIVPMKKRGQLSTKNLNNELQKIFNANPDDVSGKNKIEKSDSTFLEDDKVIMNGNNYNLGVYNGTIGVIRSIDADKIINGEKVGEIVVDFEGVGNVALEKTDMTSIDLAYAISAHKSQGSQWKHVVYAMDYSSYVLLNRQLTYTAMTRAKETLFMPVELKALQHSIDTNKSSDRCTFLEEMLIS